MYYYSNVWGQYFLSFIQEGCVKWIKGDRKDLYCEKSFLFWINAVLFNVVLFKESKKKVSHVPKTIKQHNSFNTHDKSAYYYDF